MNEIENIGYYVMKIVINTIINIILSSNNPNLISSKNENEIIDDINNLLFD